MLPLLLGYILLLVFFALEFFLHRGGEARSLKAGQSDLYLGDGSTIPQL
jgi:hypothetical protein